MKKDVNFGTSLSGFTVTDAVQVSTDRSASNLQLIEGLKKDDIVELIFEGDIQRWVSVEELERDFKDQISRGGEPGSFEPFAAVRRAPRDFARYPIDSA